MSVSIDVDLLSRTLDIYGDPDISSAYALSGHVSISLASQSSLFGGQYQTIRLLLQSLNITFEGQSELITPEFGYAPLRLCSVTRDLAPSEPLELTNDGHEDSDRPCTWNVLFNLTIPGWLPATSTFGDVLEEDAGTRYALFATAKFLTLEHSPDKIWSISTLCSAFRPRTRTVHAQKCAVVLRRLMNAPSVPFSSTSSFPMSNYPVCTKPEHANTTCNASSILPEILAKVKVVVSAPDYLSVDETSVPFVIRLRAANMKDAECLRLRVIGFHVDIEQMEQYRGLPSSEYVSRYPIPPSSAQPPNKPLLASHPFHSLYDTGLMGACLNPHETVHRSFSIIQPQSRDYQIAGDGYIFSDDYNTKEVTWCSISTSLPLVQSTSGFRQLRVSGNSPLFDVRHEAHVALICMYDLPGSSEPVSERLHFSVPLHFVHVTPPPISRSIPSSPSPANPNSSSRISSAELAPQTKMVPCSLPYAHSLPAYSQLFDSNGDRKIDHSIPLPAYTPHSTPSGIHLKLGEI